MTGYRPVYSRRGFRSAVLIAAGICVLAIAAGAFAFSYLAVRDLALVAGVSPHLARYYPLPFAALLIVAGAAVVTLRGALRGYAWLAVLVVIGAVATAETVHAMSIAVPQRPLEVTIAIGPWVAVLTGLTLLDAMIRRAPARGAAAAGPVPANGRAPAAGSPDSTAGQPAGAIVVPLSALLHDAATAPAAAAKAAAGRPAPGADQARVTASRPAANADYSKTTASPAETTASPAETTASRPAPGTGPAETTAGPAETTAGPAETTAGPAETTAGPAETTASRPAPGAGQTETTASPAETTAGQPAGAGAAATVLQAPSAPGTTKLDAPGDDDAGAADPVIPFDRMRSTPAPPEG